nr:nucleotidyltransferase domain-containing protein [Candidatus Freyrarchaeum guaymaensis]
MLGSSEERDEFRRKVIEELGSRMEEVRRVTDPSGSKVKLVGVFGSFARGNWHAGSDVDVLIV